MSTFDDAVATLYQGEPADFVARRTGLADDAKTAGDAGLSARIRKLRRPSAAAAVVNQLDADVLKGLFEVAAALRAAQTRLDGEEMKRLGAQRQKAIDGVMRAVSGSAAVKEQVRATLLAASADPAAAEAVASRALVTPLSYSGWGEVDLSDALAHREAATRGRAALRLVAARKTPDSAPETTTRPADAILEATPGVDAPHRDDPHDRRSRKGADATGNTAGVGRHEGVADAGHDGNRDASRDTEDDAAPAITTKAAALAGEAGAHEGPDAAHARAQAEARERAEREEARRRERDRAAAEQRVEQATRRLAAAEDAYRAASAARVAARAGLASAQAALAALE